MISKNLIPSTKAKSMVRKTSHIQLISAITTFGLFASQSVYAADEASTGIPGWFWGLLIIAILVGITLLPKKWIDPPKQNNLKKKVPTPTPAPSAKVTKKTPEIKKLAPEVKIAPVADVNIKEPLVAIKETKPPKIEETDALEDAKQLLSQQRIPQAVGVLNKGLQKNPERSDLMFALLAIYLKQNDHEAFEAQFEQLKLLDDPIALIQAEELHDQLIRPVIKKESDLMDFDAAKAVVFEPEPTPEISTPNYSTDSLAFTSDKQRAGGHEELLTPDAQSASLGKTVEFTPIEKEFSLDDIDLAHTAVETKDTPIEITAKKSAEDFAFSEFDDFVVGSTSSEKKSLDQETQPLSPSAELADIIVPTQETNKTSALVDLEFDLDDSFAIDEDKIEPSSKKNDWSTDLADETFASPTEPAIKNDFTAEIAPEFSVLAPNSKPKTAPFGKNSAITLEEEFPFLQTADTFQTRLDLAKNYITLGEIGSARELLTEVAEQGTGTHQTEARELIAKMAS